MQAHARELTENGHYSVAVKVTPLGDGDYRYVYVLMNYDFDWRFKSLSMDIPAGVTVSNIQYLDGNSDNSDDWASSTAGGVLSWTAPEGNAPLWGYMTTFVFEANRPPVEAPVRVDAALREESYFPVVLGMSLDPGLDFDQGFEDPE